MISATKESCREGGWNTAARLDDMDLDGIAAEVLYPSVGCRSCKLPTVTTNSRASARTTTGWSNFAPAPGSSCRLGLIPVYDVDVAVAEIDRTHTLGLPGR